MRAAIMVQETQGAANLGTWDFAVLPSVGDVVALEANGRVRALKVIEIEHRPVAVRGPSAFGGTKAPTTLILAVDH